jgi:hypothetical protein
MLNGIYGELMPYNDPHTAGPALWAVRHSASGEFEASVLVLDVDDQQRMGLESTAITLHRLRWGFSPSFNFGRMPDGYRKSSGNTRRLVNAGKRFRGSADPECLPSPRSLPVRGDAYGPPFRDDWKGHVWTPWMVLGDAQDLHGAKGTVGLYRVRKSGSTSALVYVGQGLIAARLRAHHKRRSDLSHRRAPAFSGALQVSWVAVPVAAAAQLLELESDLIGSHVLSTGVVPGAQFLGWPIRTRRSHRPVSGRSRPLS